VVHVAGGKTQTVCQLPTSYPNDLELYTKSIKKGNFMNVVSFANCSNRLYLLFSQQFKMRRVKFHGLYGCGFDW